MLHRTLAGRLSIACMLVALKAFAQADPAPETPAPDAAAEETPPGESAEPLPRETTEPVPEPPPAAVAS